MAAACNPFTSNLFSVDGRVAVVTGGSRGIGLMIAEGFVRGGATVYITSRKQAVCSQEATRLTLLGPGTCIGVAADIATEDGRRTVTEFVRAREKHVHVLVNNAGCNWGESMDTFPEAAWDKVLALNVKAVFHLTRDILDLLEASASHENPARVINIGSIDGIQIPALNTFSYSASKAALHHMSRVLAWHLAPKHVTVNAVAPGPFQSKMMAATLEMMGDVIKEQVPLKRIGQPSDMAGVAMFLASPAGAYVTGAVIPVDGGILVSSNKPTSHL